MRAFVKCFLRERAGVWRCVHPAELDLPQGRIQVTPGTVFTKGTTFMNVDIADLLEAEHRSADSSEP